MIDALKIAGKMLYAFVTHRLLWMFVLTAVLFLTLFARLFALQIADENRWIAAALTPPPNIFIEMPLQPTRGTIYDRMGRPLAINHLVFVVKMDPSVNISNEALLDLTLLFEENEERFIDNFPIAFEPNGGFEFTFTGTEASRAWQEHRWKDDMAIPNPATATAEESFNHLRHFFRLDPELSDEDVRRILNFRCQIFMLRPLDLRHYNPVPILFAVDVSHATMAHIYENHEHFSGLFVDTQTLREYPGGRYMSHIIGYVGLITAAQYEANRHLGYTQQDLFGRSGLENALELTNLRGTPGVARIEVNRAGRRVGVPEVLVEPVAGDRVFLSIDLELQREVYYILRGYLAQGLINRLQLAPATGVERAPQNLSLESAFISLVWAGNINLRRVLEAAPGNHAFPLRHYIYERYRTPSARGASAQEVTRIIADGIRRENISPAKMLLALIGTEQIVCDGAWAARLVSRPRDALYVLIEMLEAGAVSPAMFNSDPVTGSVVILDVHTGGVLAAVSYPTFDNNRMVNVVDNEYFARINSDPTRPLWFRAIMESLAPGSTFKMIPAVAAMEMGTIGTHTTITSPGYFRIGDEPYPLWCHHRAGHGRLNVAQAIAVSCNVFFAESIFRIGNNFGHATRNATDAINILNDYMMFFGLHEPTGVELVEHYNIIRRGGYAGLLMASPELYRHLQGDTELPWLDAFTSQVSIGQHISNYTPAQMARAMMGLANRAAPYPLHFVRLAESQQGHTILDRRRPPEMPPQPMQIANTTWDAVTEGMRLVTQPGARGTGVNVFSGFDIPVAGKTGTAEQYANRFSHTAFGAFAPIENPQIAIYVNVPHSSMGRALGQISARIARQAIGAALATVHTEPQLAQINLIKP
jgi:cell division protein FtsI/penicillin-binding protein 2